jgi:hypothetical protein
MHQALGQTTDIIPPQPTTHDNRYHRSACMEHGPNPCWLSAKSEGKADSNEDVLQETLVQKEEQRQCQQAQRAGNMGMQPPCSMCYDCTHSQAR